MRGILAKGTAVVSLDTGVTLGKIDHVYLDGETRHLVAFTFASGGGLFGGKRSHIVEIGDLHAIGPDAVTLDDARAAHDAVIMEGKCRELVDLDELVKRELMTDQGTKLGHIVGLDFDPDTFRLSRIRVQAKGSDVEQIVLGRDILSIGEEMIVVTEQVSAGAEYDGREQLAHPTAMQAGGGFSEMQRAG